MNTVCIILACLAGALIGAWAAFWLLFRDYFKGGPPRFK